MKAVLKENEFSESLEGILRDHNISRNETDEIIAELKKKLPPKRQRLARRTIEASFFDKPLKRRVQIVLEALLTSFLAAAVFAVLVWKFIN